MTDKITREQSFDLMVKLGGKLRYGDKGESKEIMIGDVLEKLNHDSQEFISWSIDLLSLWQPCGCNKSLQTIVNESGWASICTDCGSIITENQHKRCCPPPKKNSLWRSREELKSPEANALLVFINNLIK